MSNASVYFILHVQLEPLHLSSPIWRRLLISGDCTLRKLHHFIQAALGWEIAKIHVRRPLLLLELQSLGFCRAGWLQI